MGNSLTTTYVPSWQQTCASKFNCTSDGLVNILGQAILPTCPANTSIPPEVWGVTYAACEANCGHGILRQVSLTTCLQMMSNEAECNL